MPLLPALTVLAALIALAAVIGVVWRLRDGRRRSVRADAADLSDLGVTAGRPTLVQFSTETCARCPQVRRMLQSIASSADGLDYIDVDLTNRPDLAQRHRVLSTPTVFVVGADAALTARFTGVPRRVNIEAALAELPVVQEAR